MFPIHASKATCLEIALSSWWSSSFPILQKKWARRTRVSTAMEPLQILVFCGDVLGQRILMLFILSETIEANFESHVLCPWYISIDSTNPRTDMGIFVPTFPSHIGARTIFRIQLANGGSCLGLDTDHEPHRESWPAWRGHLAKGDAFSICSEFVGTYWHWIYHLSLWTDGFASGLLLDFSKCFYVQQTLCGPSVRTGKSFQLIPNSSLIFSTKRPIDWNRVEILQ